jgi:hypothetical protein
VSPFIEIELYSPTTETQSIKSDSRPKFQEPITVFRTNTVYNNGFNPVWKQSYTIQYNEAMQDFYFLRYVSLNHSVNNDRFGVYNDDTTATATRYAVYCARLSYLNQGWRLF